MAPAEASPKTLTGSQARKQKRTDAAGKPPSLPPVADEGSRALAALGYSLLILMGAPIFSVDYKPEGARSFKFMQFSSCHMAAAAILDVAPPLAPLATLVMLPTAYMQRVSLTIKYCIDKNTEKCVWAPLFDLKTMIKEADAAPLLPVFHQTFSRPYLSLMYAGSVIITFTAIVGLYRPVRLGVLGFPLIVWACWVTEAAGLMPTLLMEAFLGAYVLFFNPAELQLQAEQKAQKAAAKNAAKDAKASAAAPATPQPALKSGPGTPSSTPQRKKTLDKKSLYDI